MTKWIYYQKLCINMVTILHNHCEDLSYWYMRFSLSFSNVAAGELNLPESFGLLASSLIQGRDENYLMLSWGYIPDDQIHLI